MKYIALNLEKFCSMIKVAFIGAGYMTTEHAKAFADIAISSNLSWYDLLRFD
jgi:hypothetical protein